MLDMEFLPTTGNGRALRRTVLNCSKLLNHPPRITQIRKFAELRHCTASVSVAPVPPARALDSQDRQGHVVAWQGGRCWVQMPSSSSGSWPASA